MQNSIQLIPKEQVGSLKFPKDDVLTNADDRKKRYRDLQNAMILGNTEHGKLRITFQTLEGTKAVETTVWAATESEVSLKGGVNIPLTAIYGVDI